MSNARPTHGGLTAQLGVALVVALATAGCGKDAGPPEPAPAGATQEAPAPKGSTTTKPAGKPAPKTPAAPRPQDLPPERFPVGTDVPVVTGTAWEAIAGLDPAPSEPAVMIQAHQKLWLFDGMRIAVFDPATSRWSTRNAKMPALIGEGASAAFDAAQDVIYILRGSSRGFWKYSLATDEVAEVAGAPDTVGRGGFLAIEGGKVYALQGKKRLTFWKYDPATNAWATLTNVGLPDVKVVACGITTGFLVGDAGAIFAWPDHHVQRFDTKTQSWGKGTWTSMGFRPNCDGGGFAFDAETHLLWAIQGMASRTLGVYEPAKKKFDYLRPRLPEPASVEGSRAAIVKVGDVKFLYVYLPRPRNTLWRIPLDKLERISATSRAADVSSPWELFHEQNGSSLVRRPGPLGLEGVMDSAVAGGGTPSFFVMRKAEIRRYDAVGDRWTDYPGAPLGKKIMPGVAGVAGKDGIYYFTGQDTFFGVITLESGKFQELAPAPAKVDQGARLVALGTSLWALRGAGTREFWKFDLATKNWSVAPPLPDEATPVGKVGTGLFTDGTDVYAIPDATVWKFDVATSAWSKFATLPFPISWDGGMVTCAMKHGAKGSAFIVRGGITRDFGVLDLATRTFERLVDLPDSASVQGNRIVVESVPKSIDPKAEGQAQTYVYILRGHDTHEMWRCPVDRLSRPK